LNHQTQLSKRVELCKTKRKYPDELRSVLFDAWQKTTPSLQRPEETKETLEENSEKVGYWTVRVALMLLQIGIAVEVVQIAEGAFQTIVVSVLGLIYREP
jgi:hypothetical protein